MKKLNIAVIGVGHLGSIHARIYKELGSVNLIGVCDTNQARAREIACALGTEAYSDHRALIGKVDAVSVAVPTLLHFPVALDFLKSGISVLVEKPFTPALKEADILIREAKKRNCILQVGHIERFNSAFNATHKIINQPRFIECHRLSPFPNRSLDVGVVLDVMIHDIDIVLGLVDSRIRRLDAVGIPVLTNREDIANARISFANGCVANLTASRVSDETMRKIRIFQKDTYISLNYKDAEACVYRKAGASISRENLPIEKEQPLQKELAAFIDCVSNHREPLVSGPVAREALAAALSIQKIIWQKKNAF